MTSKTSVTTSSESAMSEAPRGDSFLGHPGGVIPLFGLSLFERFSFYGMQAVLIFYLVETLQGGGLGFSDTEAYGIAGAYTGLVFLATVVGGWIADRVLGAQRTLTISALLVMAGHISLALIPGGWGLAIGLVAIAVGGGSVLTNSSAVLGACYAANDSRRDAGFIIFYQVSCIAAALGPIVTGALQTSLGFHYAFGAAAIGMLLGLAVYLTKREALPVAARIVPNPLGRQAAVRVALASGAGTLVVILGFTSGLINVSNLALVVSAVSAAAAVAYFVVMLRSRVVTAQERRGVLSFIPAWLGTVVFFALAYQLYAVIPLWTATNVDLRIADYTMPAAYISSIETLSVVVAAAIFAAVWSRSRRQPSSNVKLALGVALQGIAFLGYLPLGTFTPGTAPLLGLALILVLSGAAEAFAGPAGLSLASQLAPAAFKTQMMSLTFLGWAVGSGLTGVVAAFYTPENHNVFFGVQAAVAIVFGVILFAAAPIVRKAVGERTEA